MATLDGPTLKESNAPLSDYKDCPNVLSLSDGRVKREYGSVTFIKDESEAIE